MVLESKLLKNNLQESKFLIFDYETEGLNLCFSRPWELGFNVYHGTKLVEEHQYYIKWPNLSVSEGAAKATGFNYDKVQKEGKDPKFVTDLFDKYIYNNDYKLVTTNGIGFDVYMHNVSRKLLGYKTDYSYLTRMYDNDALSRAYKKGIKVPDNPKDFLAFQYSMLCIIEKGLRTNNAAMAKEFGVNVDESRLHGANYDIEITWQNFLNLVKKMDIQ
jgi:DNA polymerase III alpha subunit (gram-positive type)